MAVDGATSCSTPRSGALSGRYSATRRSSIDATWSATAS
jgi:hypothetical protein